MRTGTLVALLLAFVVLVGACGKDSPKPAGPDVRGMSLPDAKAALKKEAISTTVHADHSMFGVVVEENWIVCSEKAVNTHMVRLNVSKGDCG